MFLKLTMENVRKAGTVHYHFQSHKRLVLRGENGSGKSSVLEALAFTLTGRDSAGGQCPTHLVSRGEERLKTELETKNWTLTRTLTQKKNSTLSIKFDSGPKININQTRLFEMLMGDADLSELVYLAAVVPGFFMRQNPSKRFVLLSTILPKMDRVKFVSDFSGFSPELVSRMCGNFSRGIPSYHNFSKHRLDIQKERSGLVGRIEEIGRHQAEDLIAPVAPVEIDLLPIAQQYMQDMSDYTSAYHNYVQQKNQHEYSVLESSRRVKLRSEIFSRLLELENCDPIPPPIGDQGVLGELRGCLIPLPEKPSVMNLPSSDCCPSCGQVVGSLLRDQVTRENEAKVRSYESSLEEAKTHNKVIYDKIEEIESALKEYQQQCEAIRAKNARNRDLHESLSVQLASLTPIEVLPQPHPPIKPSMPEVLERYGIGPYKKDITRLQMIAQDYLKKMGAYEHCHNDKKGGEQKIKELEAELHRLDLEIGQYERFEHALRILPQEEVNAQMGRLSLKNYTMDFSDGFDIKHESGTPYECLSSGERIALDVALCVKLQEFMTRKPGWCFVDDADLVDSYDRVVFPRDMQVFFAQVSSTPPDEGPVILKAIDELFEEVSV
jgi:DNA repair exonuclease SbcCD ATPase subunit